MNPIYHNIVLYVLKELSSPTRINDSLKELSSPTELKELSSPNRINDSLKELTPMITLYEKILKLEYDLESAKELFPLYEYYIQLVNIYYEQLKKLKELCSPIESLNESRANVSIREQSSLRPKCSIKNAHFEYECQMETMSLDSGENPLEVLKSKLLEWDIYNMKVKECKDGVELIKNMCRKTYSKIKPIKKNGIIFHEKEEDIQNEIWVMNNKREILENFRRYASDITGVKTFSLGYASDITDVKTFSLGYAEPFCSEIYLPWERNPAII